MLLCPLYQVLVHSSQPSMLEHAVHAIIGGLQGLDLQIIHSNACSNADSKDKLNLCLNAKRPYLEISFFISETSLTNISNVLSIFEVWWFWSEGVLLNLLRFGAEDGVSSFSKSDITAWKIQYKWDIPIVYIFEYSLYTTHILLRKYTTYLYIDILYTALVYQGILYKAVYILSIWYTFNAYTRNTTSRIAFSYFNHADFSWFRFYSIVPIV